MVAGMREEVRALRGELDRARERRASDP
jgi:hypothetical protein